MNQAIDANTINSWISLAIDKQIPSFVSFGDRFIRVLAASVITIMCKTYMNLYTFQNQLGNPYIYWLTLIQL